MSDDNLVKFVFCRSVGVLALLTHTLVLNLPSWAGDTPAIAASSPRDAKPTSTRRQTRTTPKSHKGAKTKPRSKPSDGARPTSATSALSVSSAPAALSVAPKAIETPPSPVVVAPAASSGTRISAIRTNAPPVIDGKLEEAEWTAVAGTGDFRQLIPFGGEAPSEPTKIKILYDDQALYVGFECEQKRTPISALLTRRDEDSESDWVELYLDSRRDGRMAMFFALNVAGVLVDGTLHDGATFSTEWDENWEGRAALTSNGWSAEIRIPLRALRYASGLPVQDWGIWASRFIAARQERDDWPFIPREVAAPITQFGRLDDLRNLPKPSQFEARPFILGRVRRRDSNPEVLAHGWDSGLSGLAAGLDLKLHLTQSITLDAAVNPDFAQVEADQLVFNVSNYETAFPEKRALFLEGADLFVTPLLLFYSRRIGSSPTTPTLRSGTGGMQPAEGTLVDFPSGPTIYSAAKVGGRFQDAWTFGFLTAFSSRNQYAVQLPSGVREERTVEPLTAFNVLRLRRDLGTNAQLGLMATGTTRFELTDGSRTCPTGDVKLSGQRCFHDAYVGGVDGSWRFFDANYILAGQLAAGAILNGAVARQADGTTVGPGDRGLASWARLAKDGGSGLLAELTYSGVTRRLTYNDVGFMPRQNLHEFRAGIEMRSLVPGERSLEHHLRLDLNHRRNLDGLDLGTTAELGATVRLRAFWTLHLALTGGLWRFDDREIGDGAALERAGYWGARAEVGSDPRRALAGVLKVDTRLLPGGSAVSAQASLVLRPASALQIEVGPQIAYERGEPRLAWRATTNLPAGSYVFGDLLAQSAGATVRATYTFSPRLSLQAFAQLYLASGHYTDFASAPQLPGARIRTSSLQRLNGPAPTDADFQQAALNANVLLRWDYRLGSTLFLVYSRSQIPDVVLVPGESAALRASAIERAPAVDVILAKLTLWWAS